MFTAQVSHYENLTALHKLISIVLQLANQIKQKFPVKSCGARANFLKLLWGRGFLFYCDIDTIFSAFVTGFAANRYFTESTSMDFRKLP